MMPKKIIFTLLLLISIERVWSQGCPLSSLGQNPSTAFPVCGTDTFIQKTVPLCSNGSVNVPGCAQSGALGGYQALNPYWYRFTCFSSGTLGFVVLPNNLGDDYDWMLYDITGHDPNDIFTQNLVVTGNWSGTYGATGASASGVSYIQCASDPAQMLSSFSTMPNLLQGHTYLLLVSHYTASQSGYQLYFNGGTASITDPNIPSITGASAICDGVHLSIFLSKKMKCSSLAADGSDFTLVPPVATIQNISGNNCAAGFDMDTIHITLNKALSPGNYTIKAKMGTDGNTLLDNCNNSIAAGDSAAITVYPFTPTPMDSISFNPCNPTQLFLYFSNPIYCNSIAADGSDFQVTGPSSVTIAKAMAVVCTSNPVLNATFTNTVEVDLTAGIFTGGTYQLQLIKGTDGNTLIDQCGLQVPVNSILKMAVNQSASAKINYTIHLGCITDTIDFSSTNLYGINSWKWVFDSTKMSQSEDTVLKYSKFGTKTARLWVSNGFCSDSSYINYTLPTPNLKAGIVSSTDLLCPNDTVVFKDASIGSAVAWNWDFSNGQTSNDQDPPAQRYPDFTTTKQYLVTLAVKDSTGCTDKAYKMMTLVPNCYIAVPSAFTPNGDGLNDYLYPLNAYKAINLNFKVYNRYGQVIFSTSDWTNKWDGKFNGKNQPTGTYVWTLDYLDTDSNKQVSLKGTTVLIR